MDIRKFLQSKEPQQNSDDDDFKPVKRLRKSHTLSDDEWSPLPSQRRKHSNEKKTNQIDDEIIIKPKTCVKEKKSPKNNNTVRKETPPATKEQLWVDKYRPLSINKIIGQQGPKSPLNKLLIWLDNWQSNKNKQHEGSQYKAVLISGPPGVGKTTTAHLICEHLGLCVSEINCSDSRSKKMLQDGLSYASESLGIQSLKIKKCCIIMDEVDGMAGNEDRGGIQELISIIKSTKVPVICICNDRQHKKIRSLANYCFDLRFQRLRGEQIKACLLSIAGREQIKANNELIQQIVDACSGDLRQAIHTLHMSLAGNTDQSRTIESKQTLSSIGVFNACRQVFQQSLSVSDRSDLFFIDYDLMPLFIQENYAKIVSEKKKEFDGKLATVVAYIACADVVTQKMRSSNNWSLLKTVSMMSTALPCHLRPGYLSNMIQFPLWLGKFSKQNRIKRQIDETTFHHRMCTFNSPNQFRLFVAPLLLNMIYRPLKALGSDGIRQACALAQSNCLQKTDVDFMTEVVLSFDQKSSIDTKLKSAFTRAMNQSHNLYPYSLRQRKIPLTKAFIDDEEEDSDNGNQSDFENEDKSFRKRETKRQNKRTENKKKTARKVSNRK